jgi:hypothetical protein
VPCRNPQSRDARIFAHPPLTNVDARGIEKGRLAALIVPAGGPPQDVVLQSQLIIRRSTARAVSVKV